MKLNLRDIPDEIISGYNLKEKVVNDSVCVGNEWTTTGRIIVKQTLAAIASFIWVLTKQTGTRALKA